MRTFIKNVVMTGMLICFSTTVSAAGLQAGSKVIETAAEGVTLEFYISAGRTGVAIAKECPKCDPIRLTVTPKMKLYASGQQTPIEWTASLNLRNQKADILYLGESKELVEIFLH